MVGRIKSTKNLEIPIGIRTRVLTACGTVFEPPALPRTSRFTFTSDVIKTVKSSSAEWARFGSRLSNVRNVYEILVGKPGDNARMAI